MKKYKLGNFTKNIDKVIIEVEEKKKYKEIAKVISSLQQPLKNILLVEKLRKR